MDFWVAILLFYGLILVVAVFLSYFLVWRYGKQKDWRGVALIAMLTCIFSVSLSILFHWLLMLVA